MGEATDDHESGNAHASSQSMSQTDLSSDSAELKAYARAKQAIGRELHFVRELVRASGHQECESRCQQLMAKLAEDHFTLAVLGQFKRGKSTLMNAVLGRQVLPTGVLPLTSAITVLKFGPREKLVIHREGALFPEEMPVSCLADYVTEKGNPGNEKRVTRACLELPLPFLRRGLEFVDTPGVGSSIEANSAITYNFIPQCDAVIFVTSVDSPLSQVETEFLARIREHVRKIFFVVNKTDLADDSERQEVLDFIRNSLVRCVGTSSLKLYPLSALTGLAAKLEANEERQADSGLQAFEQALAAFLSEEKTSTFLVSIVDHALHLLDEESRWVQFREKARRMSGKDLSAKIGELHVRFSSLREERRQSLVESRIRCVGFLEERLLAQMEPLLNDMKPVLAEEMKASLDQQRRAVWGHAAARSAQRCVVRLRKELQGWMTNALAELTPALNEMLRSEWYQMSHHLERISVSAAQVFEADTIEETTHEASSELPFAPALPNPSLVLTPKSVAVPLPLWCLPVILGRTWLRERLNSWLEETFATSKDALRKAAESCAEILMGQFAAEFTTQADRIESRILRVVSGKEPLRGSPDACAASGRGSAQLREEMESLRNRLTGLRDGILGDTVFGPEVEETPPMAASLEVVPQGIEKAASSEVHGEMEKDLQTRGCPVCNRISRAASDFFVRWQYDLYGNEHVQQWYAANLGFCPLHTWQLEAVASPHGISHGYPRLAERFSQDLVRLSKEATGIAHHVFSLVQRPETCRVCQELRECESVYLRRLAAFLNEPEARRAYGHAQGVCLRHLALLIKTTESGELARFLLKEASRRFEEVAEDMQSYSLKHDAVRRALHNQNEDDAYLRALIHIAGAKNLFFPWSVRDGE